MREKISPAFIKALQIIQKTLDANKIEWIIVGSLSLSMQGVDVEAHDIDILTTKEGALKCQDIWSQYVVTPVEWSGTTEFESYFGKFRINNVPVEVMGELKVKRKEQWESLSHRLKEPTRIVIHNIPLPVSALEEQLIGYTKSTRDKDRITAILIELALKLKNKEKEI